MDMTQGKRIWGGDPDKPVKTMIVLGSGGHTAEMLKLVDHLAKDAYKPRCYVVAATDSHSAQKVLDREKQGLKEELSSRKEGSPEVTLATIPRSREVGQPFITSVWTTLVAIARSWSLVLGQKPDLVLVNGPGTCIPICFWAWFLRLIGLSDCRIVYIESIARVTSLSLSGKILYHARVADMLLVQWPRLSELYPRAQYVGRLY